jgi:hypothetical protein
MIPNLPPRHTNGHRAQLCGLCSFRLHATQGFALRQPRTYGGVGGASGQLLPLSRWNQGTESPAEENAGETSKSPEQSENVYENKGPAVEGVAA